MFVSPIEDCALRAADSVGFKIESDGDLNLAVGHMQEEMPHLSRDEALAWIAWVAGIDPGSLGGAGA